MAEWRVLVDASLELVITVVTWWSRSRFGSIQLSDNEYSILVHSLMVVESLIDVFDVFRWFLLFEFVFDARYKVLRQSVADICNVQERGV